MDAFITRRGGAGGGLNFRVVGGTAQPENPKENTIWINTDQEIARWVFSLSEPTSPLEGEVWFKIVVSSTVGFNALTENEIGLNPVSARQYVNGAWENKTAKTYMAGVWMDWAIFVLNGGHFVDDYGIAKVDGNAGSVVYVEGVGINVAVPNGKYIYYMINKKIDMTPYKTVKIRFIANSSWSNTGTDEWNCGLAFFVQTGTGNDWYAPQSKTKIATAGTTYDVAIDVSNVSGENYLHIKANYATVNATITDIELVRKDA